MKEWLLRNLWLPWKEWRTRHFQKASDVDQTDADIKRAVDGLMLDARWKFYEAMVVRERQRLIDILLMAKGDDVLTIQGKIKSLNWLLQMSLKK